MEGENNYSAGLQQPDGGYGDSNGYIGGYSDVQSPPRHMRANQRFQSVTPGNWRMA